MVSPLRPRDPVRGLEPNENRTLAAAHFGIVFENIIIFFETSVFKKITGIVTIVFLILFWAGFVIIFYLVGFPPNPGFWNIIPLSTCLEKETPQGFHFHGTQITAARLIISLHAKFSFHFSEKQAKQTRK